MLSPGYDFVPNIGLNSEHVLRFDLEQESEQTENECTSPGSLVAMQAELKRLKKENRQLKMEREILKKAAAFFGVSYLAYLQRNKGEVSIH